jgi:amino acid adenylation domain-containing protein
MTKEMGTTGKLSQTQRASLIARLRQGRNNVPTGISRRQAGIDVIPLSFGQEQLWFIDQLAPGLPTYNIAGALRFAGPLETEALAGAIDALVARHEVLRTRLIDVNGQPRQVIDAPVSLGKLVIDDLAGVDEAGREAEFQRLAAEEAGQPFVLGAGPLIRLRLVRMAHDAHVLLVVVHHTVFDGWSFGVLTNELLAIYQAIVAGQPGPLPGLPIQFADYAIWERERLQGSALDELVGYWTENLAGAPSLQLPTDRPRPLVQTYDGGIEHLDVDRTLLDGLKAISRSHNATLFVTLMTAFQVLLSRYSDQDDIVVGTVSANRSRSELAPLIGYLVNTLAIRGDLSGDPAFPELLERVRTATLGSYAHQDLPFAKLVNALRVHRDPSRHPVFQVGFTLAESYEPELRAGGLTVTREELLNTAAKFDLLLSATDLNDRLRITASYASALFDGPTVRRMLGNFHVLLQEIVADPHRRLSRLPVMSAADLRREIVQWNATSVAYPSWCLHEKFEAQARHSPDAVAVELDGDRLTYAQLNAAANQVARRLRGLGVQPETLVGVCMQRSIDRMVALLGILKSGGGYVPLDPEYPADRLAFMLDDAQMLLVVTDQSSEASVPSSASVLSLDRERAALSGLDAANPAYAVDPSAVAYVIYTSGSTGRPKGVVIEHRQAVNFATAEIEHWPLGPGDRVLQFASLNFDVSVLDMFGALLSGATLVLGKSETLLSPPRLADLIRRDRITFMCLPPAVLNLLADEQFPDLRVVIAGGEAFSSALVRAWARPGIRFINGYGPTETTVGATMLQCENDGIEPPPIGLPLTNYTAYVLDRHGTPVPLGVAGELHIGGAGVARGYLNRPELTEKRFIPDPFSDVPGARLFKTGDAVRRMPNGNLQFLGRLDDQVKIRGLRIELGEIEGVLCEHPAVLQSVIVVGEDRAGDKQLIAYARVREGAPPPSPAGLRQHLADKLPNFMVPPHILVLGSFPLNANGKVDRSRLPQPEIADNAATYAAPRTLIEAVLVDTYGSLLNVDRVGVDDSFFDLGGNSLQAMQLISRLGTDLAVDTDVTAVFLAPTPAQLALVLRDVHGVADSNLDDLTEDECDVDDEDARHEGTVNGRLIRLSDGTGSLPLYVIHAIGGTAHGYASLARELADTYEVWGVEAAGVRAGSSACRSLDQMVGNYVGLITDAQPGGPYRLAGWSMGGLVALRIAERLIGMGKEVALVTLLDAPTKIHEQVTHDEVELAAHYVADAARGMCPKAGDPPDPRASTVADQLLWLADGCGAGDEVQKEIERRFRVYEAHYSLIAGYRPHPLDVDVLVVTPREDTDDLTYWAGALGRDVRGLQVPGDHYSFLQEPGARMIGLALAKLAQPYEISYAPGESS